MSERKDIILNIENMCTSFFSQGERTDILKNVTLKAYRGRTLGVVGESGCGKSVTMHSAIRLLPETGKITAGSVAYTDKEGVSHRLDQLEQYGSEMRSLRGREIGIIFQDPMASLNPVYTVGAQIVENLRQHEKMTKAEAYQKAVEMLKRLGIPEAESRVNDYPHQFSGGMKQRVMIAIAMVCNPELIIADEPTTALDVTIQAQIMELMKGLQTEYHKTIILITHNMGLIAEMADDVAVMYMGRVVEYGTLEDIFLRPAHPYTKALLKSVPVLGLKPGERLSSIRGSTPRPNEIAEGCEFYPRCDFCDECCKKGEMPNIDIGGGHLVRCARAERGSAQ